MKDIDIGAEYRAIYHAVFRILWHNVQHGYSHIEKRKAHVRSEADNLKRNIPTYIEHAAGMMIGVLDDKQMHRTPITGCDTVKTTLWDKMLYKLFPRYKLRKILRHYEDNANDDCANHRDAPIMTAAGFALCFIIGYAAGAFLI